MGLGICACCQYPEQLPASIRLAFAKNCIFQLTALRRDNPRTRKPEHFIELLPLQEEDPEAAKLMLQALPPLPVISQQYGEIKAVSRQLLSRPRAEVEREIEQRLTTLPNQKGTQHGNVPVKAAPPLFG